MELTDKIDSEEKWKLYCAGRGCSADSNLGYGYARLYTGLSENLKLPWWASREQQRISAEVYERTETLQQLCDNTFLHQYYIHVSREEPSMVAYTPSYEAGERDKQIRASLGSLLRKLCLFYSDAFIQSVVSNHQAEMLVEFKIATTKPDVQRVYTTMLGDTGCMRYPSGSWGYPDDIHPSHVYADNEHVAVAYLETPEGKVTARSVIYTNGDDKRYVRLYGTPVLGRLLEKQGYRKAGLAGAKLRAIDVSKYKAADSVLSAYLDGPGGAQSDRNGSKLLRVDDELWVLSSEQVDRFTRLGKVMGEARQQSGSVAIPRYSSEPVTSVVTGQLHNELELLEPLVDIEFNGVVGRCAKHEIPSGYKLVTSSTVRAEAVTMYTIAPAFRYGSGWCLETEDNRIACGYRRLTGAYYPEAVWSLGTKELDDGAVARVEDVVELVSATGEHSYIHKSKLKAHRKTHQRVLKSSVYATYVDRTRSSLRRLDRSWIDLSLNSKYVETVAGEVVLKTKTNLVRFLGEQSRVRRDRDFTAQFGSLSVSDLAARGGRMAEGLGSASRVVNAVYSNMYGILDTYYHVVAGRVTNTYRIPAFDDAVEVLAVAAPQYSGIAGYLLYKKLVQALVQYLYTAYPEDADVIRWKAKVDAAVVAEASAVAATVTVEPTVTEAEEEDEVDTEVAAVENEVLQDH